MLEARQKDSPEGARCTMFDMRYNGKAYPFHIY